ncbi:hypothetical protein NEMIN01_1202 [Nematocida minor]|uniref:uncharacterized protein n=1 Tax=Nematocida minor TaxID=1912983 RepID=UPI002220840C|nr:uncharacterized protein NEMIN01_1202 [Nematocida minor]KAI5190800.1 hypothetical protein NEMIN01_1202 [Nematocida minor]
MRYIFTIKEIEDIVVYLKNGVVDGSLLKEQRNNFKRKCSRFYIEKSQLYLKATEKEHRKKVVGNDDRERLKSVLDNIHLPHHEEIKTMRTVVDRSYVGFKKTHIDNYVKKCMDCQKYRSMVRLSLRRMVHCSSSAQSRVPRNGL